MEVTNIESARILTESEGKRLVLLLQIVEGGGGGGGHVWPLELEGPYIKADMVIICMFFFFFFLNDGIIYMNINTFKSIILK